MMIPSEHQSALIKVGEDEHVCCWDEESQC